MQLCGHNVRCSCTRSPRQHHCGIAPAAVSRLQQHGQQHVNAAQPALTCTRQVAACNVPAASAALAAAILFATQPALAWQAFPSATIATIATDQSSWQSTQQQQQQQHRAPSPYADVADGGLFGSSSSLKDPVEPFTLYGSTSKRFEIEKLQGEKVVKRQRGFTVESCVGGANASAVDSRFESLPAADRVQATGNAQCVRAEGEELKPACALSCQPACKAGLDTFAAKIAAATGLQLDPAAGERLVRSCTRSCAYECGKSGQRAHDFSTVYRK